MPSRARQPPAEAPERRRSGQGSSRSGAPWHTRGRQGHCDRAHSNSPPIARTRRVLHCSASARAHALQQSDAASLGSWPPASARARTTQKKVIDRECSVEETNFFVAFWLLLKTEHMGKKHFGAYLQYFGCSDRVRYELTHKFIHVYHIKSYNRADFGRRGSYYGLVCYHHIRSSPVVC